MVKGKKGLAAAVAAAMILGMTAESAPFMYASRLEDQLKNAADQIDDLEQNISDAQEKIEAKQKQKGVLEAEISEKQEKISTLSMELDSTKADLYLKQKEISKAKTELEENQENSRQQYEHMKLRIRYMYEHSTDSLITYILQSGSLGEVLRRANYFQAVTDYDRQKLEEYKKLVRQIKKEKRNLENEKKELEQLEARQEEQMTEINSVIDQLKSDVEKKLSQINQTKEQKKAYKAELRKQKKYEARLERQKAEADRKRMEEIRKQEEELARKRAAEEEARQARTGQKEDGSGEDTDSENSGQAYAETSGDLEVLSTIIYCEAGGEPYEGQIAVGSVVMNRVESSSFPNSIPGVVFQSGQFSPVASGRYSSALAQGLGSHCIDAAREVLSGRRNVSCLYFCVNTGSIHGTVIGHHVFY